MSYIPGGGMKKPLNTLQNPVYPNIKKGPPRFVWSRKHWTVEEGDTLKDVTGGNIHKIVGDSVLLQSRDQSRIKYGVSSHKDAVNDFFRPPIQTIEDLEPLSRQRRRIVWGRINPYTDQFQQDNKGLQDQQRYTTERVKDPWMRPIIAVDVGGPIEHQQISKNLKPDVPQHSVVSGFNPRYYEKSVGLVDEDKHITHKIDVNGISGYATTLDKGSLEQPLGMEKILTDKKQNPMYVSREVRGELGAYDKYGNKDPSNMKLVEKLPTSAALSRVDIGFSPLVDPDISPAKKDYDEKRVTLSVRPDFVFKKEDKVHTSVQDKKVALKQHRFSSNPNLPLKDIRKNYIGLGPSMKDPKNRKHPNLL